MNHKDQEDLAVQKSMTFLGDCFSLIFKSTNNLYFKYSKWELSDVETWVLGIGSAFFQVEVQAKFLHFFANLLIYLMSFQSGQTI